MSMRRRSRFVGLTVTIFAVAAVLGPFWARAAANAVPASRAVSVTIPVTVAQLTPQACASLSLTAVVLSGSGTSANDLILGTVGNDSLSGSGGTDCILGGGGNDNLSGGGGGDVLDGGPGTDTCDGGNGSDGAINCESLSSVP